MTYKTCSCDTYLPFIYFKREIDEIISRMLPALHAQSSCRCPASHPRVKPLLSRYCIKNGVGDTTTDQVLRFETRSIKHQNVIWYWADIAVTINWFLVDSQARELRSPSRVRQRWRHQFDLGVQSDWRYYANHRSRRLLPGMRVTCCILSADPYAFLYRMILWTHILADKRTL